MRPYVVGGLAGVSLLATVGVAVLICRVLLPTSQTVETIIISVSGLIWAYGFGFVFDRGDP